MIINHCSLPIIRFAEGEERAPILSGEALDGVAEGGAGDALDVCTEEVAEGDDVAFAGLAEQPAVGFVHEVVRVGEVAVGQLEGEGGVALPDPVHGGDDGDALVPHPFRLSQAAQAVGVVRLESFAAEDLVSRQVDEVPVVDAVAVCLVKVGHGGAHGRTFGSFIMLHKDQQAAEAHLVQGAFEQ